MNKEKFIEMLNNAKEDEYGRLYVIGDYNNRIYFGTITTICEDIFKLNYSEENQDTAELYDRHFWGDDTFECHVVSTKYDEEIKYKSPKRIEELDNRHFDETNQCYCGKRELGESILVDKINELVKSFNRYECLIEKSEEYEP